MRRLLSLALLLLFALAPITTLLPGSDEAALPQCCRRHGAHHCAMAMAKRSFIVLDPTPRFAAADRCPLDSAQVRATTAAFVFAHFTFAPDRKLLNLTSATSQPGILTRAHTYTGRGPPAKS